MAKSSIIIGILVYGDVDLAGTALLKKAAVLRGHTVRLYRAHNFQYTFEQNVLNVLYQSRRFNPPDIMIIRPDLLANIDLSLSIVKQLQLIGVPVINNFLPITRAKNKVRTLQILAHAGIPVPKTVVVSDVRYLDKAIAQVGRFPLIVKLAYGAIGNGVSILESRRSLRSFFDFLIASTTTPNPYIMIQEYVKEAKGKDLRVFVVGGKIVAAMERSARRGEFRANFSLGGSVALADLTKGERAIAIQSAELLGLDVAGVDIIRTAMGPKILEVNSNPGLKGITHATGVDVAGHIIQLAEQRLKVPQNGKKAMAMSG